MFHPNGPTFLELARQALSSTQRGYDLLAAKFDYTPFRTPDELLESVATHIGESDSMDSALDVCCGTGAAMRMLRPLCRERVVGIDFSHNMMAVARQRIADAPGDASMDFVMGNVLEMPFEEEFDLAVCFGALGHILPKDQERFVDQVASSLRPGGRFVFVTSHMPRMFSLAYWFGRCFNAAMHVRNFVIRPPFVMFYLTFLVPEAKVLLERRGFQVEVAEEVFSAPFQRACLVIGRLESPEGNR
ncbi:MAG: SAM-dependent methyltransferase [Planctomycetaceae bacterium]|nr:SAM-dependent methyltransferase [Planctomycetaceae bacterium]